MNTEYKNLFGVNFMVEEIDANALPIFLSARRSFFKLSWSGNTFLLIRVSSKERFGVIAFEKQAAQLSAMFGMPVAFEFDSVSKVQRDSLINKDIPFISCSGQLYLPFLGMALSNRFMKKKETKADKMMPITQTLFLYLLYKSDGNPIMKKEAAKDLGVTKTSITRASDQLSVMGLISQEMHGKEKLMSVVEKGIDLYEKAKPYLINPIQKTVIILADDRYRYQPLSGESALSKCTMLNPPRISSYAVHKSYIDLESLEEIDVRWTPEEDVVKVELWKYDPKLFEKNGIVDPVSLSLCFEDNTDERIEGSLEEYLEDYQW